MPFDLAAVVQILVTLLAAICALSVAVICFRKWSRSSGYKSSVYLAFTLLAAAAALLNVAVLVSPAMLFGISLFVPYAQSMVLPFAVAYVGFVTALFVPMARALGSLR
jgi:hypothetical protein